MSVVRVGEKSADGGVQQGGQMKQPGGGLAAPSIKVTEMFSRCSSQGGWSGDSAEYIQNIRKILEDPSRPMKCSMHYISDDAVAFNTPEGNSVILVRSDDVVNIAALNSDAKFHIAREAFRSGFPSNKVLNIVSCNRFMYNRYTQMAAYITQTLNAEQDDVIKDFNISTFGRQYHIDINTDMSNVRQFFDTHSPAATTCMDFGFIASVVDKDDNRFQSFQKPVTMFGATGYVEFVRNEAGTFTPLVHVTDILSVLASSKILALAIPLIGEVMIGRNLWRQQFSSTGKSELNIGNLLINAADQKPYEVKSEADFRKLFSEWLDDPILCIDIPAGAPSIPGITRITRAADHDLLAADIYSFLNMTAPPTDQIGENIFKEVIGVLDTAKATKMFTNLMDSREITYLWAVSKTKWSPKLDALLIRNDADPAIRFEKLKEIAGDIVPLYSSMTTLLYDDFIRPIAIAVSAAVNVNMPPSADMPTIDLSGFSKKAYRHGSNIFGQTGTSALIGSSYLYR